jgi:hypothetical protein
MYNQIDLCQKECELLMKALNYYQIHGISLYSSDYLICTDLVEKVYSCSRNFKK